jgi:hypothetical protein
LQASLTEGRRPRHDLALLAVRGEGMGTAGGRRERSIQVKEVRLVHLVVDRTAPIRLNISVPFVLERTNEPKQRVKPVLNGGARWGSTSGAGFGRASSCEISSPTYLRMESAASQPVRAMPAASGPQWNRTGKAGSAQAGSAQAGSVQAGSAQAGSVQAGSAQAGSVQAGSAQAIQLTRARTRPSRHPPSRKRPIQRHPSGPTVVAYVRRVRGVTACLIRLQRRALSGCNGVPYPAATACLIPLQRPFLRTGKKARE